MNATLKFILSMCIFGTIGVFRRHIPLPSALVAQLRGLVGMLFLLALLRLRGGRLNRAAIRRKLPLLCLSGAALGINWILLFEAYNYTSIATATLCYYFAPIFILLAAPLTLGERLTARKGACVAAALAGMALISGVFQNGLSGLRGILLGLGAAVFYACVVLLNKRLGDVPANDRTVVQLGASSAVLLPYVLFTTDFSEIAIEPSAVGLLLLLGVVHTGVAYALYFGALRVLRAQTAAMLSYIDPVVAILISALLLREPMDACAAVGAALVLGAAIISELPERRPG